jgi:hypothetical protein
MAEQSNAPTRKLRITPEYAGKVFERWKLHMKMRGPPSANSTYPLEIVGQRTYIQLTDHSDSRIVAVDPWRGIPSLSLKSKRESKNRLPWSCWIPSPKTKLPAANRTAPIRLAQRGPIESRIIPTGRAATFEDRVSEKNGWGMRGAYSHW